MDLEPHVQRLREHLTAAAALGDEQTRATASALADAAGPSAQLVLLSALGEFADEIAAQLPDRSIDLRMDGDRVRADVRASDRSGPSGTAADDLGAAFTEVGGDISRVTLRLVEQLKAKAEEAASENGVSLNAWMSQAVQGALRDQMRGGWPTGAPRRPNRPTDSTDPGPTAGGSTEDGGPTGT
ncbi:toxin-antitoxin system HicB family antitoxin [Rhodococcus sp. HNM0569]|nr:toxin-antitoxin system HicB family antitoxin [Rhodococcus sp. HNM0569]NLU81460.1 toxin-antitoxin system HicB family antitoxin [Rhodococcus sp. HNM0569]